MSGEGEGRKSPPREVAVEAVPPPEIKPETRSEPLGPPVAGLSFELALAELEAIVQKLERGQLDLDASIAAYERGTELRLHCQEKLKEAELRIEKLGFDRGGRPTLTPFEPG